MFNTTKIASSERQLTNSKNDAESYSGRENWMLALCTEPTERCETKRADTAVTATSTKTPSPMSAAPCQKCVLGAECAGLLLLVLTGTFCIITSGGRESFCPLCISGKRGASSVTYLRPIPFFSLGIEILIVGSLTFTTFIIGI